jgi:hypothetical protein
VLIIDNVDPGPDFSKGILMIFSLDFLEEISKFMYYYSLLQFEMGVVSVVTKQQMGQMKKMMIFTEEKYFQILAIFCDLNETQNMRE